MFFIFSSVILTGMNHVAAYRAATANSFNHITSVLSLLPWLPLRSIFRALALLAALV